MRRKKTVDPVGRRRQGLRWLALAGLLAAVSWISWQAFVSHGWFTNPSTAGPQRGDALAVVVAVLTLAYTVWADRRDRNQPPASPAAADEVAPSRADLGWLDRLLRLGDDPAFAVARLRVHPCLPLPTDAPAGLDPELPTWIERNQGPEVLSRLAAARRTGGMLVLIGGSSVGKTRLLYEAAAAELAGWPVLAPRLGDGGEVNKLADHSEELDGPVVVWLDELHRYLSGPWLSPNSTPITAQAISRLRTASTPVVILGSMWPRHLRELRAIDVTADTTHVPLHAETADILREAEIIPLEAFRDDELEAARRAGALDPRVGTALADPQFGFTEALAGVPALMQRYRTASEEPKAVLDAAIDAQRLGVPPPLPALLLAAAARGYLVSAHPTDSWAQPTVDDLSRADRPDDRATAPLPATDGAQVNLPRAAH